MGTSFAAYASQFLNRQHNPESSESSSQPLFFSFTTDNGSRTAINNAAADSDMDDMDDPHLRTSSTKYHQGYHSEGDGDDDDPYLRLDEEDQLQASRYDSQAGHDPGSPELSRGWLAHIASPPSVLSRQPSSSSSDSAPPPDFFTSPSPQRLPPPPSTHTGPISLSLTESLLPRDGHVRPIDVFSLPDPRHTPRGRHKHNDSIWTVLWCTSLTLCIFSSILILFLTHKPSNHPPHATLPYTTLLHTVPLLTILTFLSALAAYAHIFLLRIFVRPVMVVTSVFIPATLFVSALWAFVGSFMWEAGQEPTWGETIGLRLFAIVPLVLSFITARRLLSLPRDIHTTSSTLTLSTHLLLSNPFLLLLSPSILLLSLIVSIPFFTLIFRLLLIGYFAQPIRNHDWEWHVKGWANWAIFGTVGVWLWSWGVARGILRTTCAGVIGAWYFANPELPPPPPTSTHTIHASLTRATSPSLGSIILSALLLTLMRLLTLLAASLRVLPSYLPLLLRPWVLPLTMGAGMLENTTETLSKFALVYTGLTGDSFMTSARRARALTEAVESTSRGKYKRRFKTEPPLAILTIAPLTLTFPFALTTYLFVAHTLGAPDQALGAAVLAGGVTALVGLFCVGLVKDTADTLYICYCIDKDVGEKRRVEVFSAFEYENRPTQPQPQQPISSQSSPRRKSRQAPPPQPSPLTAEEEEHQQSHTAQRQQRRQSQPPTQQTTATADPDPFEIDDSYREHSSTPTPPPNPAASDVKPYTVFPELSDDDDDLERQQGSSQLFPGSDLF